MGNTGFICEMHTRLNRCIKLRNIVDQMAIFFVKLSKYYPFTIIDFSI